MTTERKRLGELAAALCENIGSGFGACFAGLLLDLRDRELASAVHRRSWRD
jgi:hypothetical protein